MKVWYKKIREIMGKKGEKRTQKLKEKLLQTVTDVKLVQSIRFLRSVKHLCIKNLHK